MDRPLRIFYLAAEVVPFAKTGGLADVAGALPKALSALGHDVRVCLPRYGRIGLERFGLRPVLGPFPVPLDEAHQEASILERQVADQVPVYFVENAHFFDRDGIYMYPDDAERFIFWCRAALEMLKRLNWRPDIIHCNDWHTAIVPNWLKTIYRAEPFFGSTATVYTIHNLAYQGIFGYRVLEIAGLDEYGFLYHPDLAHLNEVVDFMARGIRFADVINTVSPTYAREILTSDYGERLDPLLRDRQDRLFGILNGIDTEALDPRRDPHIARHFDIEHLEQRAENKRALQEEAGLPVDPRRPLIGAISRLTDQKGFDLLSQVLEAMLSHLGIQFVLLGTGEERYHEMFSRLAERHPQQFKAFLTFNTPLAQRIYAGTDMFLMPSRFEPCGLGQMIAMRYGSVPIVRRTGGLADTVEDYDSRSGGGSGFVFEAYDGLALHAAVVRAVEIYRHPEIWRGLMRRGMGKDYSWGASAQKYVDLYRQALRTAAEERAAQVAAS